MKSRAHLAALALVLAGLGVSPASTASTPRAEVSPTDLPPSAPGRLAFSTASYFEQSGLAVEGLGTIGLDGTDRRTLTEPPSEPAWNGARGWDHSPQWSPDGTWIAYTQHRPGYAGPDQVAALPRDGGVPQVLDPNGAVPHWSPDGSLLAWLSISDGTGRIALAEVDTSEAGLTIAGPRFLTVPGHPAGVVCPKFSPDGRSIAFQVRDPSNSMGTLYSMSVDGEHLLKLSEDLPVELGVEHFAWSPDGTRLMFNAMSRPDGSGSEQIWLVGADGSDLHMIHGGGEAAWHPAGAEIAIAGPGGITRIDVRGNELPELARGQLEDARGVAFAPDGTEVYTVADPPGGAWEPDLYAVPVNGDPVRRLTFDHTVFPWTVQAIDPGQVLRQFGDGPVATAASAVTGAVEVADTLVVSASDDFAASLAAAPLAARLAAPQVLTRSDGLSPQVLETAERIGASRVVLVGPLSSDVAASLRAAGLTVTRAAASASPYRNSVAIAALVGGRRAFVVPVGVELPSQWRLPLATSGLAAWRRQPILYTTHRSVPQSVVDALRGQRITSVTVVGDDRDVSPSLVRQLRQQGVAVSRVRTSDPYLISARFAQRAVDEGAATVHPVVATGSGWAASAAAPSLAALLGQASVLVDRQTLDSSKPTSTWLGAHDDDLHTARLIGGIRTVLPRVEVQLEKLSG